MANKVSKARTSDMIIGRREPPPTETIFDNGVPAHLSPDYDQLSIIPTTAAQRSAVGGFLYRSAQRYSDFETFVDVDRQQYFLDAALSIASASGLTITTLVEASPDNFFHLYADNPSVGDYQIRLQVPPLVVAGDLQHFLVDNPGAAGQRTNGVTPASGQFAFSIAANNQVAIGVNQGSDFPAIDLYQSDSGNTAPLLRVSTQSPNGALMDTLYNFVYRRVINGWGAYIAPPLGAELAEQGALVTSGTGERPYMALKVSGITEWVDLLAWKDLPPALSSVVGTVDYLPVGSTDSLTGNIVGSELDLALALALPADTSINAVGGVVSRAPAGSTETLVGSVTGRTLNLSLTLDADKTIDTIVGNVEYIDAGSDSLTGSVVENTLNLDLTLLAVNPANATITPRHDLPGPGQSFNYELMVDASGSFLPVLVPAGYTFHFLSAVGYWTVIDMGYGRFIGGAEGDTDPTHTVDGKPEGRLILAEFPAAVPHTLTFRDDALADRITANDAYLSLECNAPQLAPRFGQVYVKYRLTGVPLPVWTETLSITATGETSTTVHTTDPAKTYRLDFSGTWIIGSAPFGNIHGDAIWRENTAPSDYTASDVRVQIDSTPIPVQAFQSSHAYTLVVSGTGSPLSFKCGDGFYGDNAGSISVTVTAL